MLVVFSFMVLIVPFARARVYMCGRVVGWLPRAVRCLFVRERAGLGYLWATGLGGVVRSAWRLPRGLVSVWVASRERAPTRGLLVGWGYGGCGLLGGAVRPLVR